MLQGLTNIDINKFEPLIEGMTRLHNIMSKPFKDKGMIKSMIKGINKLQIKNSTVERLASLADSLQRISQAMRNMPQTSVTLSNPASIGLGHAAIGSPYTQNTPYVVGQMGKQIIYPPKGSKIKSNQQVRRDQQSTSAQNKQLIKQMRQLIAIVKQTSKKQSVVNIDG